MPEVAVDLLRQGGWVLVAILAVSLVAWAVILRTWLRLRAQRAWQIRQGSAHAGSDEWFELVPPPSTDNRAGGSPALAVRRGSMDRASFAARVMPLVRQRLAALETPLPLIAVLATAMPLLGLLGTVVGMMQTFEELTAQRANRSDAFASGISQAMITTQAGLVVAVPVLLVHRLLAARIQRHGDATLLTVRRLEAAVCRD